MTLIAVALTTSVALQAAPHDLNGLARTGWAAARAAAPYGGGPQHLVDARRILAEIDASTQGTIWQVHGAYAHALIAAAIAASQDERQEMELYLTHARDLSERLQTSKYPAEWPLAIDEAEGELFLEVDQYEDAVRAYQRAVERPNAHFTAWLGLARSADRMGNTRLACDAYGRIPTIVAGEGPGNAVSEAKEYLKRCR